MTKEEKIASIEETMIEELGEELTLYLLLEINYYLELSGNNLIRIIMEPIIIDLLHETEKVYKEIIKKLTA